MNEQLADKFVPFVKGLQMYHRYKVDGLSHLPKTGGGIVACTHSLATYDILMLIAQIYDFTDRIPRSLIDRLFYKIPMVGKLMEGLGCVVGDPNNAASILSNGELLVVAPGGMEESLRSSKNKYQIKWGPRKGFAKLAMTSQVPVILAACPDADNIYEVTDNPLTEWAYRQFKVPLFFAKGLGSSFIPKPVKLTHFLSPPIYPPPLDSHSDEGDLLNSFHDSLCVEMAALIQRAREANGPALLN